MKKAKSKPKKILFEFSNISKLNQNKGITLIALIITIIVLIILVAIVLHNILDNNFIKTAINGSEKYIAEMENEKSLFDQVEELLYGDGSGNEVEPEEPELPSINLPKYIKIVEKGTDKKISDYVDDKGLQFVYNGNKITNVNELQADKYNFFYNKNTNTMEGVTSINQVQDLSGKGHTLNLKNGVLVKKDNAGDYYLDFDGQNDYGEISILEQSINWADGFEIEFEARWDAFNYWARLLDFGTGIERDCIIVCNNAYNSIFNFSLYNGTTGDGVEWPVLSLNEKAKFKINCVKISGDRYNVYLYKNGSNYGSRTINLNVNNIARTRNYIGKANGSSGEGYFDGRIYNLKIKQADGTEILRYDMNEQFGQGLELYVIGEGYNDDIIDAAEKNHTLYLKNGANVKKDEDGDYYIEFDGRDDYGVIDELEQSIRWSNGFEIEFVAEWHRFGNYSRICDFSNGISSDNIIVGNSETNNIMHFNALYGNIDGTGVCEPPVLVPNERVIYKINYGIGSNGSREVVITKNGREVFRQRGIRSLKDMLRTVNYIGKSPDGADAYFSGKIYCFKVTQSDGTEVMHYDINRLLNKRFKNIKITNIDDWNNFVNKAKAGATFFGRKVTLSNDLNLGGETFSPLPRFEGVFDGNNKKIQGLNISSSGDGNGIFRYNSGIIQNLNIENGAISSGSSKTGLIAGVNTGVIDSVNVSGKITGYDLTGGISGYGLSESVISNCTNSATISGRNYTRRYTRTTRIRKRKLYRKLS